MADEAPEVQQPDVPKSISKEELDAMLGEQATALETKFEEKLEGIKQELTPQQQAVIDEDGWPWEKDPNFQIGTIPDMMKWVDKMADKKLAAKEEEITNKVVEKLVQDQKKYQEDLQESNKILNTKIAETKKSDPSFNEDTFYKFIGDWNLKHPSTKLEDFDAAYDFFKQVQTEVEKPKKSKSVKIVGAPSNVEDTEEPKQMYFNTTNDAVRAAIADFKTGYEE